MSDLTNAGLGLPQEPLSKMKLFVPQVLGRTVRRPRLLALVDQGVGRKLTLVSAPAGSGKTSLLSEWCGKERGARTPLTWLSLEEADNHPARFWLYVLEAIERLQPGITADLRLMMTSSPIDQIVRMLANQLADLEHDVVMVLDDYHTIVADEIHRSVASLLDLLPPRFHLMILTRVDPPLPLTRLRVRGEMTEVRLADLRFTTGEAAAFLEDATGRPLTERQVELLEQRTEGWIAGLQLAALSMQGLPEVDSFVHAFAGSHRYIVDYLIEEVLRHLPPDTQTFLLKTSILERLSGPLCDAVTGGAGSQEVLEELERRNLFLVALDHHRQWYRYHHLFAEALKTRLGRDLPGEKAPLHRRASEWYEQAGLMEPAVNHALAAEDPERAVRLVANAAEQIWHQGQNSILMQWLEALPERLVRSRPDFLCSVAWACVTSGRLEQAFSMLKAAERLLGADTDQVDLLGGILAGLAHCARVARQMAASAELTRRALAVLPLENAAWRGMAVWNQGALHQWCGELEAANASYEQALQLFEAAGDVYGMLRVTVWNGEILADAGRLPEALAAGERALALAVAQGEHLPLIAIAHLGLGELLYERYELEEAERHLQQAVEISRNGGLLDVTWLAYIPLAVVKQAQGDPQGALAILDAADAVAPRVPWANAHGVAARASILLAQGRADGVQRLLPQLESAALDAEAPLQQAVWALAALRVHEGRPSEAVALLDRLAQCMGSLTSIRHRALQVVALRAAGDVAGAQAVLEQAQQLAARSGNVAPFREFGFSASGAATVPAARVAAPVTGLVEPLSEREREVLALLADGASNEVIARRLFITLHTAKKHVANLMGKLDAANRTQAVARGRELGLL